MKKVVLDTNAYSRLMEGDERVKQVLEEADRIFLPLVVIAELLLGFRNGSKEAWNREVLQRFESKATVLRHYPTDETVEIFSDLLWLLKKAGKPIPVHDIWIAATAVETGSTVITYDRHFLHLEKVRLWREMN